MFGPVYPLPNSRAGEGEAKPTQSVGQRNQADDSRVITRIKTKWWVVWWVVLI